MQEFRIFTEGPGDVKFISDYVEEHFGIALNNSHFDVLKSWCGYKEADQMKTEILQNRDNGRETIIILDADSDFITRQSEVLADFLSYNVPIHLFLFPNNAQTGTIENLLCEIAVEQSILRCFEQYETCIAGHESPVIKSKVFAYLDAILPSVNKRNNKNDLIQEANRNYRNTAHWNLHHEYLQPLHGFLSPFFTEPT